MSTPNIVVTDHAFGGVLHEQALADRIGAMLSVHQCVTEDETRDVAGDADVLLVNFAPITRGVLEAMRPSAVVIRYGIGYDNVDIEAARELGIPVCNVPDYGVDTVADHTVACLLALLRRLGPADAAIRRRGWLVAGELGLIRGFAETTVGLVGTGRIGRAVAGRLRPFGFHILAYDPYVDPAALLDIGIETAPFDEVLSRAHAISLHAPLTDANRRLMDADAFAMMRPGSYLVNTSRGGLVDEAALIDALRSGHLSGAALDVFDPEPLDPDSALREIEEVILTPHAAFYSESSLDALQRLASEEAERALNGAPLRCSLL